ncbi:MAG TPA: hypothetical protein VGM86_30630 [Thermoanaerobaculia bacterium]|jgi:hypothetical protein
MSTSLSVAEILTKLETRIAHHEQQMAFHKQQEAHHRERSAAHAAELEKVRRHFESFQAAALPAADLAGAVAAPEAGKEEPEDLREFVGKRLMTSKLIARVIRGLADETFGATRVARETNRRYGGTLKKPVDARAASIVLRRLRDTGELRQVQPGGAAHEAVYAKGGGG